MHWHLNSADVVIAVADAFAVVAYAGVAVVVQTSPYLDIEENKQRSKTVTFVAVADAAFAASAGVGVADAVDMTFELDTALLVVDSVVRTLNYCGHLQSCYSDHDYVGDTVVDTDCAADTVVAMTLHLVLESLHAMFSANHH